MLGDSHQPLWLHHDLAMLDLDGVVYIGGDAVAGAPDHLDAARQHGMRLAFVTNNASRTPAVVAQHLTALGVAAEAGDVVTSAQAAARVLVDRLGHGARVVLLGTTGLEEALAEAGLLAVGVEDDAVAVVTGYGPDVVWRDIMRAAVRIREGLWWVASNTDMSIPTPFGSAPGHGVLVDMLRRFTGVEPSVAGKPARPLLDETIRRVGGQRPLMVGDRLDTDILGARNADLPSLLVMTGVTGIAELVSAEPGMRPTYLAADLSGLGTAHLAPEPIEHGFRARGWEATVAEGALRVSGQGDASTWWRAVATVAWTHLDETGAVVEIGDLVPPTAAPQVPSPVTWTP